MRTWSGTIFELSESGFGAVSNESTVPWNGANMPRGTLVNITRFVPDTLVLHTWRIYAEDATERYDSARHFIKGGVMVYHRWEGQARGLAEFGDTAGANIVVESEAVSLDYEDMLNYGMPLRIKIGAATDAVHSIHSAHYFGEPIAFDQRDNGTYEVELEGTDNEFGPHDAWTELNVEMGLGFGHVSTTRMSGYLENPEWHPPSGTSPSYWNLIAGSEYYQEIDVLPSMRWNVDFRPRDINGNELTDKQAIVVLGDLYSVGVSLGDDIPRAEQFIKYVSVPFTGSFALPQERQRAKRRLGCSIVYEGVGFYPGTPDVTPPPGYVGTATWESVEIFSIWSRRNSIGIAMSKGAFGLGHGGILDDLNATAALNWATVGEFRRAYARYVDEADVTYKPRFHAKLIPITSFAIDAWKHFVPGEGNVAWGSMTLTAPADSNKEFFCEYGSPGIGLKPYRFVEFDFETSEDLVILEVEFESNFAGLGGSKSHIVALPKGREKLRIDLRDPDTVNDIIRDELPKATGRNPMAMVVSPSTYPGDLDSRFEGQGFVSKVTFILPAGASITVHGFQALAESASITPQFKSLGGHVDDADFWRVTDNTIEGKPSFFTGLKCNITAEDWSTDSGWIAHPQFGKVACFKDDFDWVGPLDLFSGATFHGTALTQLFTGYMGMSDGAMIYGSPVTAAFEYVFGNLTTGMAVPPVESRLRYLGWPIPPREFQTARDGLVIHGETSHVPPGSLTAVSAVAISHPEVRTEVPQWSGWTNALWMAIQFDPRGGGKSKPSRDRSIAQRHIRATINGGRLWVSRKGNRESDEWENFDAMIPAHSVCCRIAPGKEELAYILVESRRRIRLYRCPLGVGDSELANDLTLVRDVGIGEFATMVILPDRRKCCYWLAGGLLVGSIVAGDDKFAKEPFEVMSGVQSLHLGSERGFGGNGELGVWLAVGTGGVIKHLYSQDGIVFSQHGEDSSTSTSVEVVDGQNGRRHIYTVSTENPTEVWVEVRSQDGHAVIGRTLCYSGIDEGTCVGVRWAIGSGGSGYFAMTAFVGYTEVELRSQDGLSFS